VTVVRGIIFDLDGTLIDSLADIAHAMNSALTAHGLPTHTDAAYRKFVGEGVANLVKRALPADRQELFEPIMADYRVRYADAMTRQTRVYPGIEPMLLALQRRRLKLAVLSNKPDLPTNRLVQHFFPRTFDVVMGERMGAPRKPDPQITLEILAQLGLRPGECAFVGDTRIDMETAIAARMLPVGVTWGFRDEAELRKYGAQVVLKNASELIERLTFAPDA
jgi:phosphoglycolate phosphatase